MLPLITPLQTSMLLLSFLLSCPDGDDRLSCQCYAEQALMAGIMKPGKKLSKVFVTGWKWRPVSKLLFEYNVPYLFE